MRAIVMGTKRKFQNHGIESGLFITLGDYVLPAVSNGKELGTIVGGRF